MADYLDVLVLCADPVNLKPSLNLAQELVHFERVVQKSALPIRMRRVFPPTLDQLRKEFARAALPGWQPSVFHFLGHGDHDGLYFENELGEAQLVKGHEVKEALAQSPVKLALLNACWSATKRGVSLIEFLTREQVAEVAIGHETPVEDISAVEFSKQFYSLITQGKPIRVACQQAANLLAEQGKSGATDVKFVGNGDTVLTTGIVSGSRPCVIETGMPALVHLPEPPAFYGRGEELVQLSQSFADVSLTGFGLWGIGGIGKTALAKVAARRNAWRYDAASWVDIRDIPTKNTVELLRMALIRMHRGAPDDDPVEELCRRMQASPSLIVLDNLEDLPETEYAALARFLQQVPKNGSRVLMTARVPLPDIERLTDVQSRRMTEGLSTWDGAIMVQRIAEQKKCKALRNELRFENSQPVGLCVHVTNRLHGHPKMLELAVGVGMKGRDALEKAMSELPNDLGEQLTALLETNLRYLGDDGNRVLPLLCFFPTGNMTAEALHAVAMASILSTASGSLPSAEHTVADEDSVLNTQWLSDGRDQLVLAGVLEYDQTNDIYTFHQAILDEADRRRSSGDISNTVAIALLTHYAEYVKANHSNNELLERIFWNVVTIMESLWNDEVLNGERNALITETVAPLGNFFQERSLWQLAKLWHSRAISFRNSSQNQNAQREVELAVQHFQLAQIFYSSGELSNSRNSFENALTLFERNHTEVGVAGVLHGLAQIESFQGNKHQAKSLFDRSIAIKRRLNDKYGLATSLLSLAIVEEEFGNVHEADRLLEEAMEINREIGNQRGVGAVLHERARRKFTEGNSAESRAMLLQACELHELLNDQRGLSACLHQLATVEADEGNPSEARRLLLRVIQIQETIGDIYGLSASFHELANIEAEQGDPHTAIRLLNRSLEVARGMSHKSGMAATLHQLARVEFDLGNVTKARSYWEQALQLFAVINDVAGKSISSLMLAQLEKNEGNMNRAIELARTAAETLEKIGHSQATYARDLCNRMVKNIDAR